MLSNVVMKHLLRASEPHIFSDQGINGLAAPGKKVISKQALLEIWELVYGMGVDESLAPGWHYPGTFQSHLADVNERRGRLARDLVLPPDWSKAGIYTLRREGDDAIVLGSRVQRLEVKVPAKYLENIDIGTVHLQVNVSEKVQFWPTRQAFYGASVLS